MCRIYNNVRHSRHLLFPLGLPGRAAPAMTETAAPLHILMHPADNVAIVANDGGLPAGTVFASGLTLREKVPQGHKVALVDIPAGSAVVRYNVPIGYAEKDIAAGSWVHERLLRMPEARSLDDLPIANAPQQDLPPLPPYVEPAAAQAPYEWPERGR